MVLTSTSSSSSAFLFLEVEGSVESPEGSYTFTSLRKKENGIRTQLPKQTSRNAQLVTLCILQGISPFVLILVCPGQSFAWSTDAPDLKRDTDRAWLQQSLCSWYSTENTIQSQMKKWMYTQEIFVFIHHKLRWDSDKKATWSFQDCDRVIIITAWNMISSFQKRTMCNLLLSPPVAAVELPAWLCSPSPSQHCCLHLEHRIGLPRLSWLPVSWIFYPCFWLWSAPPVRHGILNRIWECPFGSSVLWIEPSLLPGSEPWMQDALPSLAMNLIQKTETESDTTNTTKFT